MGQKKLAGDFFDFLKGRGADLGTPQQDQQRHFVGREGFDAFLNGEVRIDFQSSFLTYGRYDPDKQAIELGFKDGTHATYGAMDRARAESLLRAESKGKWLHALRDGYNPDGTWRHKVPYYPGKTLEEV